MFLKKCVSSIDTSGFVLKTQYDTDKSDSDKKIPDASGLVKRTDCNTKITKIENKILFNKVLVVQPQIPH